MRNICSLNRTVQSRYAHCINYEMCIFCSYNQLLSENSIAGESQILNVFFTESISRRRKICYNFCIKRHWGIEMIDREEFRDLLYSIFYESVSDPAIIHKQHEKIRMWIQANIPSKLYRYRNVNAHTLDAFKKDEIWGSSVYTFNDPFECMPHCDPNRAKDILKMELNIEQIAEKFRAYQRGDDQTLQAVFSGEQLQ